MLPWKVNIGPTKMSVCRSLLINRTAQIQLLNNFSRTKIKTLAHYFSNAFIGYFAATLSVNIDRYRFCDAYSVGNLYPATLCNSRSNNILAIYRAIYAPLRSTFVGSLPEKAPPPWHAYPP